MSFKFVDGLRFVGVDGYCSSCFADLEFSEPWYVEKCVLGSIVTVCFSLLAIFTKTFFEELDIGLEYMCGIPVGVEGSIFGL